jgi:8-oxo-dGTP pyrophosphatase MutT (NUDIX family)
MMATVERTGSREVYANAWMTVREDGVRRPDGSAGIYGVIDKPDYALVIAARDGRLHLVEQFRYPLGLRRWEFPQGTAPDRADAAPAELAARELREETGLRAERLTQIGLLDVAPGMSSQRGRVFLAIGLTEGRPEREPEEQDMRSGWFTRSAVEAMITNGDITDAQSIAAYGLLLLRERVNTAPDDAEIAALGRQPGGVWQAHSDSVG